MILNKEEIKNILSKTLECSAQDISDTIKLTELGFDSMKFVKTVVEIETKYNIEMLDSDLLFDNFKNVVAICDTLKKYFEDELQLYKCIITDCDGVLWHGVAGESGCDSAYTDDRTNEFCTLLRVIRKNGILLAICSKNERENINLQLGNTSISSDDFAIIEDNVADKPNTILSILQQFGFSTDNAVYIDDSDAELEYIKKRISGLTVIKADYSDNFSAKLKTMFSDTQESDVIDRTAKFREQKEREKIRKQTNFPEEYNRILETRTVCEYAKIQDKSRLSELSQRANRFNLTGEKYSENLVEKMLNDRRYSIYKLSAMDKFGDMGLVAMAIVHDTTIENFIMSCRVFGRGFEKELLEKIISDYCGGIIGIYHPTGKNDYCVSFYNNNGVSYELR